MLHLLSLPLLFSLASAQFVFFGGNQAPRFGGQPQPFRSQQFQSQPFQSQQFQSRPSQPLRFGVSSTPAFSNSVPTAAAASPASAGAKGNYQWGGKNFLLTWRNGQSNFAWSEGVSFCRSQGMQLVSLDSAEKADHFLGLIGSDRSPYSWVGGEVSGDSRTLSWLNGKTDDVRKGQHPWSFTGRTGPQPDGGERCLAILNNTYRYYTFKLNTWCIFFCKRKLNFNASLNFKKKRNKSRLHSLFSFKNQ